MKSIYSNDGYFQAILQLRPKDKEILEWVYKQLIKNDVKIGKEVERKEGMDLYLSSKKFTLALGKKLKKTFKGTTKVTKTLFTQSRITSKKVYRITVCFRLNQ